MYNSRAAVGALILRRLPKGLLKGNKTMSKQINLLNDSAHKLFFHYLIPSVSATLVTSVYILADTIFIGHGVGETGIAALNVVLPLFSILFGIGLFFGVGGSVMMSVSFGSGDIDRGRRYFTLAFKSLVVSFIVVFLLLTLFFDPIMRIFGATNELMPVVKEYAGPFVYASGLFMISTFMQAFVRNDKAPKVAMAGVITGGLLNIILDYIFVFPMGMGMFGAALASVIGTAVSDLIFISHFFSKSNNLRFVGPNSDNNSEHGRLARDLKYLSLTARTGFSSFMIEISNGVVIWLFNLALLSIRGSAGVTAYGILSNSAVIILSLSNGIAQAAQPIVSTNFGAGNKKKISEVIKIAACASAVLGIASAAVGELFPEAIIAAFVKASPEVEKIALPAVRIYFASFLLLPLNILAGGCFQSTMNAGSAFLITFLRGLVLCIILLAVLPVVFGVNGVWAVMPITELLTFITAALFVRKNKLLRG